MKEFLKKLISNSNEVSSKRLVGLLAFILLSVMVIVHLTNYKIIQSELIYSIVAIISACFGLNAVIDAKAFSNNKVIDNLEFLNKKEKPNLITPIKEDNIKEETSKKIIIPEIEIQAVKNEFKKPLDGIKATTLLQAGSAYIGIKEVSGKESNKTILEFAKRANIDWYNSDEIAWCAIFVNAMCDIVGLPETSSALAKSFLNWGQSITIEEALNDSTNVIGIFNRGKINSMFGHVAILGEVSSDKKYAKMLGGNQNDSVCMSNFLLDNNFLGFRRGVCITKVA